MAVLMPALSSVCLSHLAIELDVMALCGFMNEMNNLVFPVEGRLPCSCMLGGCLQNTIHC